MVAHDWTGVGTWTALPVSFTLSSGLWGPLLSGQEGIDTNLSWVTNRWTLICSIKVLKRVKEGPYKKSLRGKCKAFSWRNHNTPPDWAASLPKCITAYEFFFCVCWHSQYSVLAYLQNKKKMQYYSFKTNYTHTNTKVYSTLGATLRMCWNSTTQPADRLSCRAVQLHCMWNQPNPVAKIKWFKVTVAITEIHKCQTSQKNDTGGWWCVEMNSECKWVATVRALNYKTSNLGATG